VVKPTGDESVQGVPTDAPAMLSPRVEAGLEYCARCGERILQGEPWDLGHDDYDRRLYLGPEHRRCNRSAAGKKSVELQRCKTSREW